MITSSLLVLSDCNEPYSGSDPKKIIVTNQRINRHTNLISFFVPARNWEIMSSVHRIVDIPVPEINEKVIGCGVVKVYLEESYKTVKLPFTYYQIRRPVLIEPTYQKGHLYIHIHGNFIMNINSGFKFKVLVIAAKLGNAVKLIDWDNYTTVKEIFKL